LNEQVTRLRLQSRVGGLVSVSVGRVTVSVLLRCGLMVNRMSARRTRVLFFLLSVQASLVRVVSSTSRSRCRCIVALMPPMLPFLPPWSNDLPCPIDGRVLRRICIAFVKGLSWYRMVLCGVLYSGRVAKQKMSHRGRAQP